MINMFGPLQPNVVGFPRARIYLRSYHVFAKDLGNVDKLRVIS